LKKRTRARELALQFLYQNDLVSQPVGESDAFLRSEERDVETRRFAKRLIAGTVANKEEIDRVIQEVAQNWNISRMAVVDRNVLRLATHELLHCRDIPPKVAINEAIEIGKRYSTQNSGAFINGILDKIMNKTLDANGHAGAPAPAAEGESLEAVEPEGETGDGERAEEER
jgi:transcription antitermination factor NusB